jgi:hypothetical protein
MRQRNKRLNSRWFKEERALPRIEYIEAKKNAKEVIRHSTLVLDKLTRIIDEEIQATYDIEEDFLSENYRDRIAASGGARIVLRKLKALLDIGAKTSG